MITSVLTVPNLYNYDISKIIDLIWKKPNRQSFYSLLAAILPYYPSQLDDCANNKTVEEVLSELTSVLQVNQQADAVVA